MKNTAKGKIEAQELEKENAELLEALEDMIELVDTADYYNDTVQNRAEVVVARARKRRTKMPEGEFPIVAPQQAERERFNTEY